MLGRALSLAAVTLLIGCFAAPSAWAQAQNLEAGKSPSQLFAGTCNACHKGPRGLLRTVSAGSLPGFLRQHYTTSSDMASQLSAFLISNGASDNRNQAKQGADTKPGTDQVDRQGRRLGSPSPREAVKPDADVPAPQGRNAKRMARPGETPDAARPHPDGQAPAPAVIERGPDGRKLTARQRPDKRGRPGSEELPVSREETPKPEPAMENDKANAETAGEEGGKPDGTKPVGEGKSEAARIEIPKGVGAEVPVMRPDPVPPVTPAPPAASATVSGAGGANEPTAATRPSAPVSSEPPAAVTASAPPPPPPTAAAGPPAPPISQ